MSSNKNNVTLTLLFDDDSTRNYTFEDVSDSELPNLKARIQAINTNANNEYANFYQTFVSDDGEPVVSIIGCQIATISEEVLYGG